MKARKKKTSKKKVAPLTPAKLAQKMRQNKVVKIMVDHGGKIPAGKAMKEAGYSDAYAHNPQKLSKTKTWNELVDEFINEADLAAAHNYLLKAAKIETVEFDLKVSDEEVVRIIEQIPGQTVKRIVPKDHYKIAYFYTPDNRARKDGVELGYKIHGKFAPDKIEHKFPKDLDEKTDEELAAEYAELIKKRSTDANRGRTEEAQPDSRADEAQNG